MKKYFIGLALLFSSCDVPERHTVKVVHQDDDLVIYAIWNGNGWVYVTNKGNVSSQTEQHHYHPVIVPSPR